LTSTKRGGPAEWVAPGSQSPTKGPCEISATGCIIGPHVLVERILEAARLEIEVRQSQEYRRWFERLNDPRARARIDTRIRRLTLGNLGDCRPISEGVVELRVDYGPGYRV
jgi:hypothetical protein